MVRNLSVIIVFVLFSLTLLVGIKYFTFKEFPLPVEQTITNSSVRLDTTKQIIFDKSKFEIYKNNELHNKWGNVLGGLFTGLIIATMEFFILLDERRKMDKIKALAVKNVLFNRDDKEYYRNLIAQSRDEIKILGVTAYRLLSDFANTESSSMDDKVLIEALMRNVKIKILLPSKNNLNGKNLENFEEVKSKLSIIKDMYANLFEYKYFDHVATHSIFNVDSETIIGPVIANRSSKDTPAIHISNESKFAQVYMEYFNSEWGTATTI